MSEQTSELVRLRAEVDRLAAVIYRVTSLASNCEARAAKDRAAVAGGGLAVGEIAGLMRRADNYDLVANGVRRALAEPRNTPVSPGADA